MTDLKDVFSQKLNRRTGESEGGDLRSSAITTIKNGLQDSSSVPFIGSEKDKFIQDVSSLVLSDSFLSELQDKVGDPSEGESEDMYVSRAKSDMKALLKSKFLKKSQ